MYSFSGSAGPDEGNLLFNGNTVATNTWQGNFNTASPLIFNAMNYINATRDEFAIQGTSSGGMDALEQILVIEYQEAAPVANFTATPTSGNAPLTVQFTDASTGSVSSYAWDFNNDGVVDGTAQSPSYTYSAPGTYAVNLTVTGPGGNDSEVKTDYIIVSSPTPAIPVAAFSASPTLGIMPLNVSFTDMSTGVPTSWSWNFGDGNTSTEQNPSHIYSKVGKYTVKLIAKNAVGSNTIIKIALAHPAASNGVCPRQRCQLLLFT